MRKSLPLLVLLALAVAAPAAPGAAGVEDDVQRLVDAGVILPFEAIRHRVMSQVRGDYVGAEFDPGTLTYRFRFLDSGNVINVDVDARTGQKVRKTSNF